MQRLVVIIHEEEVVGSIGQGWYFYVICNVYMLISIHIHFVIVSDII